MIFFSFQFYMFMSFQYLKKDFALRVIILPHGVCFFNCKKA